MPAFPGKKIKKNKRVQAVSQCTQSPGSPAVGKVKGLHSVSRRGVLALVALFPLLGDPVGTGGFLSCPQELALSMTPLISSRCRSHPLSVQLGLGIHSGGISRGLTADPAPVLLISLHLQSKGRGWRGTPCSWAECSVLLVRAQEASDDNQTVGTVWRPPPTQQSRR